QGGGVMKAWYVVNTLAHQEGRAEANLLRRGYRVRLPSILRSCRQPRRIDTVPLFPGYVFVETDTETSVWSPINATFDVGRRLRGGCRSARLPQGFIGELRRVLDGTGLDDTGLDDTGLDDTGIALPDQPWFKPGRRTGLLSGPSADSVGVRLKGTAKGWVTLLLRVLGRNVETRVSTRQIASAA
ncbi:MAG: hypothetical protein MI744_08380, partial [Pseudomonadales bacterium]|nr:hypothetical protein [Pseudomonadales bacterium]